MGFKLGDVVRLVTGSPKMTVVAIDNEKRLITCKWFVPPGLSETDEASFPPEALILDQA